MLRWRRVPTSARWAALGILGAALGCQDYLFEQKCPEAITESQITVPAAPPVPVDILFVVDNSGSMADEQANLAANFNFFIDQVAGTVDYRIGIVTTDLDSQVEVSPRNYIPAEMMGDTFPSWDMGDPYAPLNQEDSRENCEPTPGPIAHGCFRGPDPAARVIDSTTMDRDRQIQAFKANVVVGSCGSGSERGLQAMVRALDQMRPGGCNAGFLRDEANLVIIFVSDEENYVGPEETLSIPQVVRDVIDAKGADRVRVGAIVGYADGRAANCSASFGSQCGGLCDGPPPSEGSGTRCDEARDCPGEYCDSGSGRCRSIARSYWDFGYCGWCSYFNVEDCCSALAGNRYISFALAMEQAVVNANSELQVHDCNAPEGTRAACLVDSICQDNFGATLKRMANELVVTNEYILTPAPTNPEGVSVTVVGGRFGEGEELVNGTHFDVTLNADGTSAKLVIKDGTKVPTTGEDVQVAYVTKIEKPTVQKGACGPNTSTSALSLE